MKAFTIDAENNIMAYASAKATPKGEGIELFTSKNGLAELAVAWSVSRLIEIWNSLPGVTPVKKFTSRANAVKRIWAAIQDLGGADAPQGAHVAPEEAPAKNKPTRAKKAPKPVTNAAGPREGSKASQVIAMLKREGGATLEQICAKFGWQQHTTRALLSAGGSLTKKHGLVVTSEKVGDERRYSVKA